MIGGHVISRLMIKADPRNTRRNGAKLQDHEAPDDIGAFHQLGFRASLCHSRSNPNCWRTSGPQCLHAREPKSLGSSAASPGRHVLGDCMRADPLRLCAARPSLPEATVVAPSDRQRPATQATTVGSLCKGRAARGRSSD